MKRESFLKTALMRELRSTLPDCVALRHEDRFTNGIPDISITMHGKTSWWECKHGTPRFDSLGNQELLCQRLAVQGYCRYIIWTESKSGIEQRTMIVHPRELYGRNEVGMNAEAFCMGFNMHWLVDQVRKAHGV